jgi:hypothetical protein
MSTPKPATDTKVGVQISKETGGAYADIREVIESELARIQGHPDKRTDQSTNRNNDTCTNNNNQTAK